MSYNNTPHDHESTRSYLTSTGIITSLFAGYIGLLWYAYHESERNICEQLAKEHGEMPKINTGSKYPFLSDAGLEDQIEQCKEKFSIKISRTCAAATIRNEIPLGAKIPRNLINDALTEKGKCHPNVEP